MDSILSRFVLEVSIFMSDYLFNPVFTQIARRLLSFSPKINILEHIDEMIEVGRTTSEGITFKAKNHNKFRMEVAFTKINPYSNLPAFHWDDRKVWVFKLAALATEGEGYREIGRPSLHIAVGPEKCNVHIDEFGFVERGADGETFFTPELGRHIFDELIWRDKIRKNLIKAMDKGLPNFLFVPAAELLDRTYLLAPSAENRYELRFGPGVKLMSNKWFDMKFEFSCGNLNCTDNRTMLKMSFNVP
jgi:hypothetical protein